MCVCYFFNFFKALTLLCFFSVFVVIVGKYESHALPTGIVPVPKKKGARKVDGWNFHYEGWKLPPQEEGRFRDGVSSVDPFPEAQKGRLDYDLLKKMGLTKKKIMEGDGLFFKQLLQPMCDPSKSGIENDPRMPYYTNIENWTAKYAATIGMYGSYGHKYKTATAEELLQWDSCVAMSGVSGQLKGGAIYRRWKPDDKAFDSEIDASMTYSRWLAIKRYVGLFFCFKN